jgi:hypothetical protein
MREDSRRARLLIVSRLRSNADARTRQVADQVASSASGAAAFGVKNLNVADSASLTTDGP